MENTVHVRQYRDSPYDIREILRYAGCPREADGTYTKLVQDCLSLLESPVLRVCYAEFPVQVLGPHLDLGFTQIDSAPLAAYMKGCGSYYLFAATAGIGIDAKIRRYARTSPSKALIFQAIGAERVEAACDAFCAGMKQQLALDGKTLKPRFSPGFGDVSLEIQREIIRVLDCGRKIGVTLNESMLMSPSKSVTAFAGITEIKNSEVKE